MSKFTVTGIQNGRQTSVVIDTDDAQRALAIATQRGIQVSSVQPFDERLKTSKRTTGIERYEDVPIFRRGRFVTWLFFLGGFFGFIFFGVPIGLFMMIWACWLMWTGNVYFDKLDSDGSLKRLGMSTKILALVLTALMSMAYLSALWSTLAGGVRH
jgi:hypothetical protein